MGTHVHDAAVLGGSVAANAASCALKLADPRLTLERVGAPPPVDITVLLWPRGLEALRELGMPSGYELGMPLEVLRYRDRSMAVLAEVQNDSPALLVQKSGIAQVLLRIAGLHAPIAGKAEGLVIEERSIAYRIGSDGHRARVLVGAAGIADPARELLFGADLHREGGTIVVGTVPHASSSLGAAGTVDLIIGKRAFLGVLPRADRAGTTWWLMVEGGPFHAYSGTSQHSHEAWCAALAPVMAEFAEPVPSLLRATTAFHAIGARRWLHPALSAGGGRVALIGDSWRAATPELGLGCTWALEDAVRLGRAVRKHGLVPGIGEYVRGSTSSSFESLFGRSISKNIANEASYALRRIAMSDGAGLRIATRVLSAVR
jgi:FAD-dependent urate hydroxylase